MSDFLLSEVKCNFITIKDIVTYYTIQKSCFRRAVPKRADESRRKPK
jgi:hypothetical protein